MAVKKIIYLGGRDLQRAETHYKQFLSDWIYKWFGKEVEWALKLKISDIERDFKANDLHDLLDNVILANNLACMALNIDCNENNVNNSWIVTQLGVSVMSELVEHLSPGVKDTHSEMIVNLPNPIETVEFGLSVSDHMVNFTLPISNVINIVHNEISAREDCGVSVLSASNITGDLQIDFKLNGAEIAMRDLFALAVGDVIELEHSLNSPLTVKIDGGEALFVGRLGKAGAHKSILITGSGR